MKNDGTSDNKNAKIIVMINKEYNHLLPEEYKKYYLPNNWIERKKNQLKWSYMLK
ncbi:hypothetical protein C1645_824163 [Glomus cerebriforme]|uniref:Uncharacterized protein n=1 Tax=Glomus cerebriforme TaxID=658196 RepID=A0A397T442_9GLOM|nr:hypothetical protein C1645_824163 [Glomus cerebriforme]